MINDKRDPSINVNHEPEQEPARNSSEKLKPVQCSLEITGSDSSTSSRLDQSTAAVGWHEPSRISPLYLCQWGMQHQINFLLLWERACTRLAEQRWLDRGLSTYRTGWCSGNDLSWCKFLTKGRFRLPPDQDTKTWRHSIKSAYRVNESSLQCSDSGKYPHQGLGAAALVLFSAIPSSCAMRGVPLPAACYGPAEMPA